MSVDTSSATATAGVDPSRVRIAGAIKQAAGATGTSFEYMLATAKMESDFNPKAGAPTSSAHGLYQFIEQTWLGTVKEAGPQLGYGKYADAITKSSSGNYSVSDPGDRAEVLKLRDDPAAASSMAAALTQSNSFQLTGKIGRRPSDSELYMAHFMGVGGAAKLISSAEDNPTASGAQLFPNAAAANRSIFYDHSGRARSVSEVYSVLSARYAGAAGSPVTRTAMASVGGDIPPNVAVSSVALAGTASAVASAAPVTPVMDNAAYLSTFPDVRNATPVASVAAVTLASAASTADNSPSAAPIFRSLFQADERSEPISATVRELWGSSSSPISEAAATSVASATPVAPAMPGVAATQTPNVRAPQPLDLFSDRDGTFSS